MTAPRQRAAFTRRAVVQALPAAAFLPLASGTDLVLPAVSSTAPPADQVLAHIAQLARELSEALNEVDGRKSFVTVYPSNYSEDSIRYADIAEAMDAAETVSPELMNAIVAHCAASAAVVQAARQADTVALGREASRDERQRLEQSTQCERDLFMALCQRPPRNDTERHEKASYLLAFCDSDELEREHAIAILESMSANAQTVASGLAPSDPDRRA